MRVEQTSGAWTVLSVNFIVSPLCLTKGLLKLLPGEGRWPRGRADVSEPGGPGFDSSSRQPKGRCSSALSTLNYCVVLPRCAVLCLASNHGIACALRLEPTQPVTDFWGWHMSSSWACGRAKRSRISDTHRLRSSVQFRYINNQSFLTFTYLL